MSSYVVKATFPLDLSKSCVRLLTLCPEAFLFLPAIVVNLLELSRGLRGIVVSLLL